MVYRKPAETEACGSCDVESHHVEKALVIVLDLDWQGNRWRWCDDDAFAFYRLHAEKTDDDGFLVSAWFKHLSDREAGSDALRLGRFRIEAPLLRVSATGVPSLERYIRGEWLKFAVEREPPGPPRRRALARVELCSAPPSEATDARCWRQA